MQSLESIPPPATPVQQAPIVDLLTDPHFIVLVALVLLTVLALAYIRDQSRMRRWIEKQQDRIHIQPRALYGSSTPAPRKRLWFFLKTLILTAAALIFVAEVFFEELVVEPVLSKPLVSARTMLSNKMCLPVPFKAAAYLPISNLGRLEDAPFKHSKGHIVGYECSSYLISLLAQPMKHHSRRGEHMDPMPKCPLQGYTCKRLSRFDETQIR